MKLAVEITIDDAVYAALVEELKGLTKPARQLPDGTILVEPMFRGVEDWIAAVISTNLERLRVNDPEIESALGQIQAIERVIREKKKATVSLLTTDPKAGTIGT